MTITWTWTGFLGNVIPAWGGPYCNTEEPVLGMSLRKINSLCSNLASVTDLKRIQTPHSLCCDFGGYKTFTTRWSGGRVQVWVQVWAPACHLAISPKAVPEGNQRFSWQNQQPSSWPESWGSSSALLAQASTNTVFPSQLQSLQAATCSLEETMLPLLRYWLSSRVNTDKVLMLCKFWAATSHFFFHVKLEWKLLCNWWEVADQSSAHSLA